MRELTAELLVYKRLIRKLNLKVIYLKHANLCLDKLFLNNPHMLERNEDLHLDKLLEENPPLNSPVNENPPLNYFLVEKTSNPDLPISFTEREFLNKMEPQLLNSVIDNYNKEKDYPFSTEKYKKNSQTFLSL